MQKIEQLLNIFDFTNFEKIFKNFLHKKFFGYNQIMINKNFNEVANILQNIKQTMQNHIIGQDNLIDAMIFAIFANGHILIEWAPGLGKTRAIKIFSQIFALDNKRISFTSDLLPSDLTGVEIFIPGKNIFEIRKGPIFTNILLADEINRTPPKVQSALLEAMEEKQITIGRETFELDFPFVVFATQNPIENSGTFNLPEAQLDRFLMKINLDYPNIEDEKKIFEIAINNNTNQIQPIIGKNEIREIQDFVEKNIKIDEKIIDYIARLLDLMRKFTKFDWINNKNEPLLEYATSSRAGISIIKIAKIEAIMQGRDYVMPEDVKKIFANVVNHRIGLTYMANIDGISKKNIIDFVLENVEILKN